MAECVNTSMKDNEPAACHAAADGGRAQAEVEQLPAGNEPLLPSGKLQDPPLERTGVRLGPPSEPNLTRVSHGGHDCVPRRARG